MRSLSAFSLRCHVLWDFHRVSTGFRNSTNGDCFSKDSSFNLIFAYFVEFHIGVLVAHIILYFTHQDTYALRDATYSL